MTNKNLSGRNINGVPKNDDCYLKAASEYLLKAETALKSENLMNAKDNYESGLCLLDKHGKKAEALSLRFNLLKGLCTISKDSIEKSGVMIKGEADYINSFNEATLLGDMLGKDSEVAHLYYDKWSKDVSSSELKNALSTAEALHQFGVEKCNKKIRAQGNCILANTHFIMGNFEKVRQYSDRFKVDYTIEDKKNFANEYGKDPEVFTLMVFMISEWFLGNEDNASMLEDRIASTIKEAVSPYSKALALLALTWNSYNKREIASVQKYGQALFIAATQCKMNFFIGCAMVFTGWSEFMITRNIHKADKVFKGQKNYLSKIGKGKMMHSIYTMILAEIYLETNEYKKGIDAIYEGINVAYETNELLYESELYRLKAELSYSMDKDRNLALDYFNKGIKISRERKAKALETRIKTRSRKIIFRI